MLLERDRHQRRGRRCFNRQEAGSFLNQVMSSGLEKDTYNAGVIDLEFPERGVESGYHELRTCWRVEIQSGPGNRRAPKSDRHHHSGACSWIQLECPLERIGRL